MRETIALLQQYLFEDLLLNPEILKDIKPQKSETELMARLIEKFVPLHSTFQAIASSMDVNDDHLKIVVEMQDQALEGKFCLHQDRYQLTDREVFHVTILFQLYLQWLQSKQSDICSTAVYTFIELHAESKPVSEVILMLVEFLNPTIGRVLKLNILNRQLLYYKLRDTQKRLQELRGEYRPTVATHLSKNKRKLHLLDMEIENPEN